MVAYERLKPKGNSNLLALKLVVLQLARDGRLQEVPNIVI